jgi:quinol monooxygenase YgiN
MKMNKIQISAVIKIPEGKAEEFKKSANECIKQVKEKDTGTLKYDWFLNSDQTKCEVREEYESSEAALQHMMNHGPLLQETFKEFPLERLAIYGDLSPQLQGMAKGLNANVYSFLSGLE